MCGSFSGEGIEVCNDDAIAAYVSLYAIDSDFEAYRYREQVGEIIAAVKALARIKAFAGAAAAGAGTFFDSGGLLLQRAKSTPIYFRS